MRVNDPRTVATSSWFTRRIGPLLNDPRDAVFVLLMFESALVASCGIGLFFVGSLFWVLAPAYWLVLGAVFLDRFTLMLHCTSHRPLFKPAYRRMNEIIPWVLGPFFGQSPNSYFAHHVGMHHREENLADDLSSTLGYQRDRLSHWLLYCGRFLVCGALDLMRYFSIRRRTKLMRKVLVGELVYFIVTGALLLWNPAATLVVFVVPLMAMRTLMMMGNWGQHAFVSQEHPGDPYLSSITCINSRYNRRCFNDGYHIGHHLYARMHWTEYPAQFDGSQEEYGKKDAIVFEGVDFFMVWLLLMTKRWKRLARAFVQLPGAVERDEDAVIALLKARVQAFVPPPIVVESTGRRPPLPSAAFQ
jgi:fatty acid desaturase